MGENTGDTITQRRQTKRKPEDLEDEIEITRLRRMYYVVEKGRELKHGKERVR